MRTQLILLLASSFLFMAESGTAQFKRGPIGIGVQAGVQHYQGDLQRSGYTPSVSFLARVMPFPFLGLQINSGYSALRDEIPFNQFYTDIFDAKLSVILLFFPEMRVSPYIYSGAGGLRYRAFGPDRTSPLKSQDGQEFQGWEEVALFGAGVEILLTPRWSVQFSGNYNYAFSDGLDGRVARNDADGFLNANLSFMYHFKSDADRDGDGIYDSEDSDPYNPEDFDGFADHDGAPDPDNDGDGIPDLRDAAPNEAEDMDGFEDHDGIPDLDNDGDGIPDSKDAAPDHAEDFDDFEDSDGMPDPDNDGDGIPDVRDAAPNVAEDKDGFQDQDGIPDPDNDGDGIPDVEDAAPNHPETVNGYQDDDGAPDTVPWLRIGERRVMEGVSFHSGSDRLSSTSYQILEKIARILKQEQDISLEIRGYTDNRGHAESNLRLSLRRANSVRAFLISKGVEPARLICTGYGEANPIAPNETAEGRRANRRIELVRIK